MKNSPIAISFKTNFVTFKKHTGTEIVMILYKVCCVFFVKFNFYEYFESNDAKML